MAHEREVFPVLVDASGVGQALTEIKAGDAPGTKSGLLGFAFRDSAGNVVLPMLNAEGKLPVTMEGAGVPKFGTSDGVVAGSLTPVMVAEVALTVNKTYSKVMAKLSCFREAIVSLVQIDDATETVIGHGIVGPGQYDTHIDLGAAEIVAGATGTQKFELRAYNLQKASDFMGHVSALEFAT